MPDIERSYMKKLLTALLCAITAVVFVFGFTACQEKNGNDTVNLVAITGEQVGVMNNVDYYVVPEPAASAKTKAIEGLNIVGDLQQLYGGENGYPQAVVVAKTELATGSSFVSNFVTALSNNAQWLANESTSIETIVDAVQSHLTDGMSPTFNAKNLTKEVISNCGIKYVAAQDSKADINGFMQKLNSVSESSFGTASDNFFWDGGCDEALYNGKVSVYAPDGAPSLGIASLLAGAAELYDNSEVSYEIVDASLIQTFVAGANPKADICVLPVNVAVKLLGAGEKYKLVGTLTHGNLYLASTQSAEITKDNLSSLKGKTVGVVNLAAVPGLTFKLILKNNGIDYTEIV